MTKLAVDSEMIRALAALLEETGLSEIEIGEGERRIRVARNGLAPAAAAGQRADPAAAPETAARPDAGHPGAVTSPMVGTVYVAPEPGAEAFVALGDRVDEGQTLYVIEAMKVMNPIRAPRAGTVAELLVENGDRVEYGTVLLILD
jgi:acetyl-CoA carboxylase biotin carboxyl carrier protein